MSGRAGLGLMSLALKVEKGGVSGRPLGGKENRGTDAYQEPLGDTALTTPQSQPTEVARQASALHRAGRSQIQLSEVLGL